MPNTLAHIGAQSLATRPFINNAHIKWVYLGCIIPDIPWIMNRVIRFADIGFDLYDVRLYSIVQSSLFFSLILSLALAMLAIQIWRVFAILGINSLLHLLLDATQTKWSVGVNLFAPFDWQATHFGLFWPESIPTYLLTAMGVVAFVVFWKRGASAEWDLKLNSSLRYLGFASFLAVFFILPLIWLSASQQEDNHFVNTLREVEARPGKYIEMDRKPFDPAAMTIETYTNEKILVNNVEVDEPVVLSIKGHFTATDTILVTEYHVHNDIFRDGASYVGLALVLVFWIFAWRKGGGGGVGGVTMN